MSACFADTSYFLAMLIPGDVHHPAARKWAEESRSPIVTSDYVIVEVGNFLSPEPRRHLFAAFQRALFADRRVSVVSGSPDLLARGIDVYCARLDKAWSLTDCISFEIMTRLGIRSALTADHHFEQAGFTVLLRAPIS